MKNLFDVMTVYEAKISYKPKKIPKIFAEPILNSSILARFALTIPGALSPVERFGVIALDGRNNVIGFFFAFDGTIDRCSVYPREIAKRLILMNAASCMIFHNHPGGSIDPSEADRQITRQMKSALGLLDISVIDHVILTEEKTYSFQENGLM